MLRNGRDQLIEPIHDDDVPESSPWVVVGREYRGDWVPYRTFIMAKDDMLIHQAKVELDAERTRDAQR